MATLVVISTMYLGIHWLVDVLAGVVLGIWCVLTAERLVARAEGEADRVSVSDDREQGIASETND